MGDGNRYAPDDDAIINDDGNMPGDGRIRNRLRDIISESDRDTIIIDEENSNVNRDRMNGNRMRGTNYNNDGTRKFRSGYTGNRMRGAGGIRANSNELGSFEEGNSTDPKVAEPPVPTEQEFTDMEYVVDEEDESDISANNLLDDEEDYQDEDDESGIEASANYEDYEGLLFLFFLILL